MFLHVGTLEIHTLEADPIHAAVACNIFKLAGDVSGRFGVVLQEWKIVFDMFWKMWADMLILIFLIPRCPFLKNMYKWV